MQTGDAKGSQQTISFSFTKKLGKKEAASPINIHNTDELALKLNTYNWTLCQDLTDNRCSNSKIFTWF